MEHTEMKEWLDRIIAARQELESLMHFNSSVRYIGCPRYIHLIAGIEIVADVMGLELCHRQQSATDYQHKYSCTYRGYEIVQLSRTTLDLKQAAAGQEQ